MRVNWIKGSEQLHSDKYLGGIHVTRRGNAHPRHLNAEITMFILASQTLNNQYGLHRIVFTCCIASCNLESGTIKWKYYCKGLSYNWSYLLKYVYAAIYRLPFLKKPLKFKMSVL